MSDATALVDRALRYANDPSARIYPRVVMLEYVNDVLKQLAQTLAQNPECRWFKWDEYVTVPAGESSVDLYDELAYEPAEIRSLFHVIQTGDERAMRPMQPGAYGSWERVTPVAPTELPYYGERQPPPDGGTHIWELLVKPPATGDRVIHVYYRYHPDVLVEDPDPTECPFPSIYDEMIAKMAARKGLSEKGIYENIYDADIRDLFASFMQAESRTSGGDIPQGTKEVVGDYLFGR